MRFLNTQLDPPEAVAAALTPSSILDLPEIEASVSGIIADVRARGDAALYDCLRRFDSVHLDELAVSAEEFAAAQAAVDQAFIDAVDVAIANVRAFHERQRRVSWEHEHEGARLGQIIRPLARIGVLAPA